MKIKHLIKELQQYDGDATFDIKLVVDDCDAQKDVLLKWYGEMDRSLLEDFNHIEFAVEKKRENDE